MTRNRTGFGPVSRRLLWAAVLCGGCATGDSAPHPWVQRARFPQDEGTPRVVVWGNLSALLPRYDATPALERWLYGPGDYGRTALRNPQGMAFVAGRLLVCDQGEPDVVAIDLATGKTIPWSDAAHGPRCPIDITVAEDGRVYVADPTLGSLLCYATDGTFLEELRPPDARERRFRPAAVLAFSGILYTGDVGGRRLARWDTEAREWREPLLPPPGMKGFVAPTGIAAARDGTLLIADGVQGMVFRIAPDGRWLDPLGRPGRGPGEFVRPKQVCVTRSGLILVTDAGRQSVLVFDSGGDYLLEIHERPGGWGGWTLPTGLLAIDPTIFDLGATLGGVAPPDRSDEYVLVSDPLSAASLTVLGVVARPPERTADVH